MPSFIASEGPAKELSFEDVVPYYKNLEKKNVIAILIDQSKQSESAFKSVVENLVPEYDPVDTQFIVIGAQLPTTIPATSTSTTGGPRQSTRDFLTQRAQQVFSASFADDSSKLPPAYTTTNNTKISPLDASKKSDAWYGHVRALYYHRNSAEEVVDRLPKLGVTFTIVALHQDPARNAAALSNTAKVSHWVLSHEITRQVLVKCDGSVVRVVKGDLGDEDGGDEVAEIHKGAYDALVSGRQSNDRGSKRTSRFGKFIDSIGMMPHASGSFW
ncbi:hypothetical protein HDU76_004483 [Blyttiomyces sp. JEL0837]|nr:hypothetical protein HDU76_004483 [Blyttiomyces sp. JEL0837]